MPFLYIARHGNTFECGDTVRRVGRRTDLPLSSSGAAQAQRLGEHFNDRGLIITQLFAAPLKRTQQTAAAIVAQLSVRPTIQQEQRLLEIDYGPDENQPEAQVIARVGAVAMQRWNDDAIPPPDWNVDPDAIIADWKILLARVGKLRFDDVVLVITSNGIARFALDAADETPATIPRKLRTGAYGRIDINNNRAVVTQWDIRP